MYVQEYKVVFDVARDGYTEWRDAIFPACLAVGGILLSLLVPHSGVTPEERQGEWIWRLCFRGLGLIGAMACYTILTSTWQDFTKLRTALHNGSYLLVEGQVKDFVPRYEGGDETFRVDTAHFSYSKYEINSGFRRNVGQGGPMREGLFVRIADVDGEIARLEIAR